MTDKRLGAQGEKQWRRVVVGRSVLYLAQDSLRQLVLAGRRQADNCGELYVCSTTSLSIGLPFYRHLPLNKERNERLIRTKFPFMRLNKLFLNIRNLYSFFLSFSLSHTHTDVRTRRCNADVVVTPRT